MLAWNGRSELPAREDDADNAKDCPEETHISTLSSFSGLCSPPKQHPRPAPHRREDRVQHKNTDDARRFGDHGGRHNECDDGDGHLGGGHDEERARKSLRPHAAERGADATDRDHADVHPVRAIQISVADDADGGVDPHQGEAGQQPQRNGRSIRPAGRVPCEQQVDEARCENQRAREDEVERVPVPPVDEPVSGDRDQQEQRRNEREAENMVAERESDHRSVAYAAGLKKFLRKPVVYRNHFFAFGLRCGHPGQQHGRRSPSRSRERICRT